MDNEHRFSLVLLEKDMNEYKYFRERYKYYNKKGQIIKIIESYDGDFHSTYEYDDYGNLILYN